MISFGIAIMFRRTDIIKLFVTRVNKSYIEITLKLAQEL